MENLLPTGNQVSAPPDITVFVQEGEHTHQFLAHEFILSGCSGYFKTILSNNIIKMVTVPNINPRVFASLLAFMYTGYLDLNYGNIYETLLASNLLHMPAAMSICRMYLSQNQNLLTKSIVKPIPTRSTMPNLTMQPIPQVAYQPLRKSDFVSSIFKPLKSSNPTDKSSGKTNVTNQSKPGSQENLAHSTSPLANVDGNIMSEKEKVIIDVASCDGPIRFHKILNENYKPMNISSPQTNATLTTKLNNNDNNSSFKVTNDGHTMELLNKKEAKQFDNNRLQYYPCKTCGSKFPSYYFVHKHRKLCHNSDGTTEDKNEQNVKNQRNKTVSV